MLALLAVIEVSIDRATQASTQPCIVSAARICSGTPCPASAHNRVRGFCIVQLSRFGAVSTATEGFGNGHSRTARMQAVDRDSRRGGRTFHRAPFLMPKKSSAVFRTPQGRRARGSVRGNDRACDTGALQICTYALPPESISMAFAVGFRAPRSTRMARPWAKYRSIAAMIAATSVPRPQSGISAQKATRTS